MDGFDIHEVRELLHHRYPFLLIDRVTECVPGERLIALKNVSVNEPQFQGHFPQRPVFPGVLIMEALAQATALLAFKTEPGVRADGAIFYFAGMDKVRFKRPVEPGDQLELEVTIKRVVKGIWMFSATARVDGKVVATGELMATGKVIS